MGPTTKSVESASKLANLKIVSLEEGKEVLGIIDVESAETMRQMRALDDINDRQAQWNILSDKRYELVKAKRSIQGQMQRLVMSKRSQR